MQLEIAVQDVPGARLAAQYGADRIELCCALQMGGLTPSAGLLNSVHQAHPELPIHVLIRPRPGDYVYDADTVELMKAEIAACRDGGATGVVIGALTAAGAIDTDVTQALITAAHGLHITFHRAIDHLDDASAIAAVALLADLGVNRILSSGGASRAGDGIQRLAAMHDAAQGRLSIMAGGGVDITDFPTFFALGITNVHLSAKRVIDHSQGEQHTSAALAEDASYYATDENLVSLAASTVGALG
ncbi:copper homeostasis protein CutC [Arthrobacter sp. GMC3]|uniref:copper homeostasis protein CutC n=1 Tax=Arthrobacter sp. GMC3 TaxID=2058894 RepID=UPI002157729C|nr:copper homeostasis protein CutC [Arthrobacter sp. GMC3]